MRGLGSPRNVSGFAKGSPFGKDFPRSGENGKAKKGNSWTPIGGLRGLAASIAFDLALHHIAAQRKNFAVGGHIQAAGNVLLANGH